MDLYYDLQFYLSNDTYYYFSQIEPSFYFKANFRKKLLKLNRNIIILNSEYSDILYTELISKFRNKFEIVSEPFIYFCNSLDSFVRRKNVIIHGKINSAETLNRLTYIRTVYPRLRFIIQTKFKFKGNIKPIQKKGKYIQVNYNNELYLLKIHERKVYFMNQVPSLNC